MQTAQSHQMHTHQHRKRLGIRTRRDSKQPFSIHTCRRFSEKTRAKGWIVATGWPQASRERILLQEAPTRFLRRLVWEEITNYGTINNGYSDILIHWYYADQALRRTRRLLSLAWLVQSSKRPERTSQHQQETDHSKQWIQDTRKFRYQSHTKRPNRMNAIALTWLSANWYTASMKKRCASRLENTGEDGWPHWVNPNTRPGHEK